MYIYTHTPYLPFVAAIHRFFFSGKPPGRGDPSDVAVHGTMSEPAEVAESDKASQEASRWGEDGGFHGGFMGSRSGNYVDIYLYIYYNYFII